MNMKVDLGHETPIIIRQFKNPQELETWYKDTHNGKTFPKVDRNKEIELADDREQVKAFYDLLDMIGSTDETILNPYTHKLEIVQKEMTVKKEKFGNTQRTEFKEVVTKVKLEW